MAYASVASRSSVVAFGTSSDRSGILAGCVVGTAVFAGSAPGGGLRDDGLVSYTDGAALVSTIRGGIGWGSFSPWLSRLLSRSDLRMRSTSASSFDIESD